MSKIIFITERCPHCEQSLNYLVPIDGGTVKILKEIAKAIGKKGINIVHPRKEIEGKGLSSNEVGNLSRPRIHGFIAKIKGNVGNYCLTTKGAEFLKGARVPKYAIRSKIDNKTTGYYMPDVHTIDIDEASHGVYWEGIDFSIVEGHIIKDIPQKI